MHLRCSIIIGMNNICFRFSNVIYGDKTFRQGMDELMDDIHIVETQGNGCDMFLY